MRKQAQIGVGFGKWLKAAQPGEVFRYGNELTPNSKAGRARMLAARKASDAGLVFLYQVRTTDIGRFYMAKRMGEGTAERLHVINNPKPPRVHRTINERHPRASQ